MTIAYICVVIMIFIPLFCTGYAKFSGKGYDNRSPREYLERLEGKAKRAHFAQLNSFENFPPFAAGVIVAHQLHAAQTAIDSLAVAFVLMRILYVFFYIQDQPAWRSTVWVIGLMITVMLFFIGA